MFRYAQFYILNLKGDMVTALGTDGVLPLDGRLSLFRCRKAAEDHAKSLNSKLGKDFVAYDIRRGNYSKSHPLTVTWSL